MSNAIRYDSLLVRELARELRARLSGRRAHALVIDRGRATVALRTGHDAIVFEIDPLRGHIRFDTDASRSSGNVPLPRDAVLGDVSAPPDERLLAFHFDAGDAAASGARTLIIELVAPRWNAIALGDDGRIHAVLRSREAGARPLVAGGLYQPLAPTNRLGAEEPVSLAQWHALFDPVEPHHRSRVLLANIAWTSPLNAAHILGDDDLDQAHARYLDLVAAEHTAPVLLATPHGPQPYPFPLRTAPSHPQTSLLEAFEEAARQQPAQLAGAAVFDIERIRKHRAKVDARIEHLRKELADAPAQAEMLRRNADLLLAQLHRVRKGEHEVRLDDFAGATVTVTLDPALAPADNAQAMYAAARKRTRAADRLPAMLARAEREASRLADLAARIERGEVTPEELGARTSRAAATLRAPAPRLPYRRYRTSGGLEV
ncbi:MAG: NFACT family protein, partial [Longimicrobiales bacterium]